MRVTVRDLIVNALDESKLCNRNQPAPANLFVSAYQLLQKRLAQYSNTNYLSFARNECEFNSVSEKTVIGETELKEDAPEELEIQDKFADRKYSSKLVYFRDVEKFYKASGSAHGVVWMEITTYTKDDFFYCIPDVEVSNVQEIVRCYARRADKWHELSFVAYEDFYNFDDDMVYSVKPIDDSNCTLYLKDICTNAQIKVIYNEKFEFDIDSTFNIPQQFVALFTAALVYDLALAYPRLSDQTVALLKDRLKELEENVRRSSSVNKFIGRDMKMYGCTYSDFVNGRFLGL